MSTGVCVVERADAELWLCPTLPKHLLFLVFYSSTSWCFLSGCFTGKVRQKNTSSLTTDSKKRMLGPIQTRTPHPFTLPSYYAKCF